MTRTEFKSLVNDEVTADCALPFTIPEKTIDRVIDKDALKWFYREYEYALEDRYLVIQEGYENGELYKKEKTIKLPDCVYSVYSVRKENSSYILGNAHKDFTYEKFIVDQSGVGSLNLAPENLTYSVFLLLYLDTIDQLTHQSITFNYNHLTQKLILQGEIAFQPLILNIGKKVPEEKLFDDEFFLRYVVGKVKQNLGRALGTVKMPLIGNAEIDFDTIRDEGKEEVQEVIEEIKENDAPDFFFLSPQ